MEKVVYKKYGGPEQLIYVSDDKSLESKTGKIRITHSSVTIADRRIRKADPWAARLYFGLFRPRIQVLGGTFSGIIEEPSSYFPDFKKGDRVFGLTDMRFGAYASEKPIRKKDVLLKIPDQLSAEEAVTIPFGASTASYFLLSSEPKIGQSFLIIGASGAVGLAAVQLAVYLGLRVTAACSPRYFEQMKQLGADEVVDSRQEFTPGTKFDVVMDTNAILPLEKGCDLVQKGGVYLGVSATFGEMFRNKSVAKKKGIRAVTGVEKRTDAVTNLWYRAVQETSLKGFVAHIFPLQKTREAHEMAEKASKCGSIVVQVRKE